MQLWTDQTAAGRSTCPAMPVAVWPRGNLCLAPYPAHDCLPAMPHPPLSRGTTADQCPNASHPTLYFPQLFLTVPTAFHAKAFSTCVATLRAGIGTFFFPAESTPLAPCCGLFCAPPPLLCLVCYPKFHLVRFKIDTELPCKIRDAAQGSASRDEWRGKVCVTSACPSSMQALSYRLKPTVAVRFSKVNSLNGHFWCNRGSASGYGGRGYGDRG